MNTPVLDRLNARIAAEPALTSLDTLFVDLQDARDEITSLDAKVTTLATAALKPMTIQAAPVPATAPASVTEVYALMVDAKERLSVHALSTVADYIDRAIKLLEPTPKETT
jgi:hypothetical protein